MNRLLTSDPEQSAAGTVVIVIEVEPLPIGVPRLVASPAPATPSATPANWNHDVTMTSAGLAMWRYLRAVPTLILRPLASAASHMTDHEMRNVDATNRMFFFFSCAIEVII